MSTTAAPAKKPAVDNTEFDTSASSLFDQALKQAAEAKKIAESPAAVEARGGVFISKDSYTHTTCDIDYSPQKLNMLARQIKGLPLGKAIAQMRFAVKKPAPKLVRTLNEIIHNTKQIGFGDESVPDRGLVIAQAWVGKGIYKHGINIHGRGRFGRLTSPSAHMKIVVKHANVPLAPNRGNAYQGKNAFVAPKQKKESNRVRMVLPEKPIYNKWKKLFFDA
ncbi:39S ribosomal protein L22, mitochondrial [Blastocladiella emersonii ATCC 22665]|nr:39S ribosomal protein L22, mitochondrial [Blastocladiella emersonii ATCC 22665]